MDLAVLKKKISTYKGPSGKLTKIPDELVLEIVSRWEQWIGPALGFYTEIGVSSNKMASIIGRGKKLRREGHVASSDFTELALASSGPALASPPCTGVEVLWDGGKLLRFSQVDLLLEFLKKAA